MRLLRPVAAYYRKAIRKELMTLFAVASRTIAAFDKRIRAYILAIWRNSPIET